jgi:Mg2+/Co2+ transporter CorB
MRSRLFDGIHFREFLLGYVDMKELNVHDIMTYKDELDV